MKIKDRETKRQRYKSKIHVFICKSHVRFPMCICGTLYHVHFCRYVFMPSAFIYGIIGMYCVSLPVSVLLYICLPLYNSTFTFIANLILANYICHVLSVISINTILVKLLQMIWDHVTS